MAKESSLILKKDDLIKLEIQDMGVDGEGIGKVEGITLFVKDAVIGDYLLVKVMKMKKSYGYARLMEILKPSPYRVEPACEFHRQCGGCQLQMLSYPKQLEYKENKINNNLHRIGGFAVVSGTNHPGDAIEGGQIEERNGLYLEPILGMEQPYFYRNKAQFPIGRDKQGNIVTGFYAAHSHTIIPNRKCFLGRMENQQILDIVIGFMEEYQIEPYNEETGRGLVRHVMIRSGYSTGEWMVCIVINGKKLPNADKLVLALKKWQGIKSIVLSINEEKTNVIMGSEIIKLWGEDYITDTIGGIRFQISPLSFYQVNPVQTERLYHTVLEYAGLTGTETVWDLYCGIGTISLFLAQKARMVYGVEVIPEAIADACGNASINGIENTAFFVGKVEEVLPAFYAGEGVAGSGDELRSSGMLKGQKSSDALIGLNDGETTKMRHPDVIVVDPPRKGCDEKCLETIISMQPGRVVYVSCDSATLARDLKYLCGKGYEVRRGRGVDMFPMTGHVETAVLLVRKP